MTPISPKTYGAGIGSAISTIFWVIAGSTFWEGTFTDTELTALVGASGLLLSVLFAWLLRDELRDAGYSIEGGVE